MSFFIFLFLQFCSWSLCISVLWLTQCEHELPAFFRRVDHRNDSVVLAVAWGNYSVPTTLPRYPRSTWSQGRNRLMAMGLRLEQHIGQRFDYFVFCDDDVDMMITKNVRDPVDEFIRFLDVTRPAVGVPRYRTPRWGLENVTSICSFDALVNAFHRDTLTTLLPYTEHFDAQSWWISQMVLERKACAIYGGHIFRSNVVQAFNDDHRDYPRVYAEWFTHTVFFDALYKSAPPHLRNCLRAEAFDANFTTEPEIEANLVPCRLHSNVQAAEELYRQTANNFTFDPCDDRLRWDLDGGFDDETREQLGLSPETLAARAALLPTSLLDSHFWLPFTDYPRGHISLGLCPEDVIGGFEAILPEYIEERELRDHRRLQKELMKEARRKKSGKSGKPVKFANLLAAAEQERSDSE